MPAAEPLSVLHVDDDQAFCDLVEAFLERETDGVDCEVTTETDPEAALDRIREASDAFDCVVSDYNMPEMDGVTFLEAVREVHPELPVLLFSGEHPDDVAAEIVRAGLTDYLRKGMGTDQYTALVRRVEHAVRGGGEFDSATETELDRVGIVGTDEQFDEVDPRYASLYEYEPEEIEGRHWTELHPEDEVEHIRNNVLPVVEAGGEWTGHSVGVRADGTTFTESKLVTALDDGRLLIAVEESDDDAAPGE